MNVYKYATDFPNPFGVSAIVSTWGNNNLDWQKTIDQNYGIDLAFLNNHLKITVDYFFKNTDPLLVYVQTPTSTGTSTVPMNLGKQVSQGVTATLNYMILQREGISWNFNFNARHITYEYRNIGNALDKFNSDNRSSNLVRYYDGGSPSDLWAVRSAGIDPASGQEVYIKKNGNYTFTYDKNERVEVGNTNPMLEGSLFTSLSYRGFTLNVTAAYKFGGDIYNTTLANKVEYIDPYGNVDRRAFTERWKKPGDLVRFLGIPENVSDENRYSERFVERDNTFAITSIMLNYEFKSDYLRKIGIKRLNLGIGVADIARFSSVKQERGTEDPFQRSFHITFRPTF